jgi:hypothetical protein
MEPLNPSDVYKMTKEEIIIQLATLKVEKDARRKAMLIERYGEIRADEETLDEAETRMFNDNVCWN